MLTELAVTAFNSIPQIPFSLTQNLQAILTYSQYLHLLNLYKYNEVGNGYREGIPATRMTF